MTEVLIIVIVIGGLFVLVSRLITDATLKIICQIVLVLVLAVYLLREFGPQLIG